MSCSSPSRLPASACGCWPEAFPVTAAFGLVVAECALAPWCPASSDWTATDVVAEYADEVGDDLRHSHGSTSRVSDHWATGAYARTTHAGPRMRNHVRTPFLSSCTPCSRCSRTPSSSTRARQDQRCSAGSSTSTMKSTANPGGPCTRPRLPGRRVSSAQSTRRICGDHCDQRAGWTYRSHTACGVREPAAATVSSIVRVWPRPPSSSDCASGRGREQ